MRIQSHSLQGKRQSNEDQHIHLLNINSKNNDLNNVNFVGVFDGHGGKIYFIKKKDRDYRTSDLPTGKFESIKKQLNGYVVISEEDDVVITVGHKYKRRRS